MAQEALADGQVSVCIDPSLNYYDGKCRVLVEGQYVPNLLLAQPVVADKPMLVPTVRQVDNLFTAGSILAEALKTIFCTCAQNIEIYALPRADAGGATKAVYTMTVTGPATSDGTIDIFLGNKEYMVEGVEVVSGDTAASIATAIAAAIPDAFPYVVTVVGAVITATAKNAGTVGNYLNPVYNWKGFSNYAPAGISIATVRTTAGAGDPAPIDYAAAFGTCCYNCIVPLTGDATLQRALRNQIRDDWDCSKPQCFGHGYVFNTGTLGQVLARGDNSAEFSRMAVPVNDLNFPWQMAAAYMAESCCIACDNPEASIQGRTDGVLSCIWRPATCSEPWTYDERVQLHEQGFVTYGPLHGGQGALTQVYVHNDVTNYLTDEQGRPNTTFRDTSSRRRYAQTAVAIAEKLNTYSGLAFFSRETVIPQGVRGTNLRLVEASFKKWAKEQVGIRWSAFTNIEKDIVFQTDFEVAAKCRGVPCNNHLTMRFNDMCRVNHWAVKLRPQQLDNCSQFRA